MNTYLAEIDEFNSAIHENRKPTNNAEVGFSNQLILTACYESAKTKKIIEIKY